MKEEIKRLSAEKPLASGQAEGPARRDRGIWFTKGGHVKPFKCGTPFVQEVYRAVDDYRNGRPLPERIAVDEVEMTVHDDWAVVGWYHPVDGGEKALYAPSVSVGDEEKRERLLIADEIEGFVPVRGHEYRLLVKRIYLADDPSYHHYELVRMLDDIPSE